MVSLEEESEEFYKDRNRHEGKQATYGRFWCDTCDYFYGGEIGKCPECGNKMNPKRIRSDRKRSGFNP